MKEIKIEKIINQYGNDSYKLSICVWSDEANEINKVSVAFSKEKKTTKDIFYLI